MGQYGGRLVKTILIAILANSVLGASRFAVPLVALSLGASEFLIGAMAAAVMVMPILTTVPYGRWMDRTGAVTPMRLAAALAVMSGAASIFRPSIASLFVTSVLAGAGAIYSHVASTKAVGALGDADARVRTLGYLAVAYSLMQFVSPLLVGLAFEQGGARAAFATLSALPLLAIGMMTGGGHLYAPVNPIPSVEPNPDLARGNLMADPQLRSWSLVYAVFQAALTLYPVVAALHGAKLGMSAPSISGLLAAQAVGAMISRAAISFIRASLNRNALVVAALILSAAAYAAAPALHSWLPLAAVSLCLGAAAGLGQPVAMCMVYETAPAHRVNEAISFASIAANVLQLLGPLASGALASLYGVGVMCGMITVSLAGAAILAGRHTAPSRG